MKLASLFVALAVIGLQAQNPPALPLGGARPETPGITRTVLKDDAKSTVTRVHLNPDAAEPPHTHPTDVILVPVVAGTVEFKLGDKLMTKLASGEVQFVPKDTVHSLANKGKVAFELIAISLK
jgi:quercetin dioxygenase-like cupin family protein